MINVSTTVGHTIKVIHSFIHSFIHFYLNQTNGPYILEKIEI